jgi:hypothetical protein
MPSITPYGQALHFEAIGQDLIQIIVEFRYVV